MQSKSPYFSIIIPCLNEEKTIPNLLGDLRSQTFDDFEVIVVDAKSTDKTIKAVEKYKTDINKLIIKISPKKNIPFQRNYGASHAKAEWLIFMDADNRIPDYFLSGVKYKIESLRPQILTTGILPDSNNAKDKAVAVMANIAMELQKNKNNPHVLESMMIIRKSLFNKVKGFREEVHWGEGGDLLRRAQKHHVHLSFTREPKYTYSFRRFRKQGTLKILRNIAVQEISILINKPLSKKTAAKLYPLEGGKYFEIDSESTLIIERIFNKIIENNPKAILNRGTNGIKERLFKFFK